MIIGFFALCSLAFMHSVNYVFDNALKRHQQERIMVALGMKDDPKGVEYNVKQAIIAIGSGGFQGKGFLNGTQTKLKFVPEQTTDFIFSTIGEEFGFWGSALTLIAYCFFILRLIYIAERQETVFCRVYGYCTVSVFLFQAIVNIGMVCGLVPVIGIPLPFFSYGGSSLLASTVLVFILLRFDAYRNNA